MDRIFERAAEWGIETQHVDGLGRRRVVEPQVLARILDSMAAGGAAPPVTRPQALTRVLPQQAYQGADGSHGARGNHEEIAPVRIPVGTGRNTGRSHSCIVPLSPGNRLKSHALFKAS